MPKKSTSSKPAPNLLQGAGTLERGLHILDVLAESNTAMSLADLSRETEIYKSTLLRLLASLQKFDHVEVGSDGRYRLGHKGLILARSFQISIRPAEMIMGALQELVAKTSETGAFHVRRGSDRVCLYRVGSPLRVTAATMIGDVRALPAGAAGKVLAAFAPDFPPSRELDQVRSQMYATNMGETDPDLASVAAPVLNANGECEGALALTGPISRFTEEAIQRSLGELLRAAADLTRRFGGSPERHEHALALLAGKVSRVTRPRAPRSSSGSPARVASRPSAA